jgi:hypothetical protein
MTLIQETRSWRDYIKGSVPPWSGYLLNVDNERLLEPYESHMLREPIEDRLTPPEVLQHAHISRWCQLRRPARPP